MYAGLPKGIYALFFAQIVNAVGNLVYPFLTLFLTQRLDYSASAAGTFILISSVAYIPGSLLGGKLVDVTGRKAVLIVTQGLAAVALVPCAFLGVSPVVPWLIIAAHFFFGAANPTHEAITTDMTTGDTRKAAFSLLYLGHNIGFSLGPMIAGFLFTHALPWLFIGDAITTFIALGFVFLLVPESKPSAEEMERHGERAVNEKAESGGLIPVLLKRPNLIAFSFIALLLTFVYSQFTFSLPLQLEAIFAEKGAVFYGALMTTNALVVIFLTTPAIAATRLVKPVLSVAIAALLFAVGFGMIYFVNAIGLFVISTIIWTVGEILQATNVNVYIANHTPISHRGRFNSVLPIIIGTGFALGPPMMGTFIERVGMRQVWLVAAVLSLVSAAALVLLYLLENRRDRHPVPAVLEE
jgi:MFS family permease